jgi:hypothetical protein
MTVTVSVTHDLGERNAQARVHGNGEGNGHDHDHGNGNGEGNAIVTSWSSLCPGV